MGNLNANHGVLAEDAYSPDNNFILGIGSLWTNLLVDDPEPRLSVGKGHSVLLLAPKVGVQFGHVGEGHGQWLTQPLVLL